MCPVRRGEHSADGALLLLLLADHVVRTGRSLPRPYEDLTPCELIEFWADDATDHDHAGEPRR